METENLLFPCAHCGGSATLNSYLIGQCGIECNNCSIKTNTYDVFNDAVTVWNTRTPQLQEITMNDTDDRKELLKNDLKRNSDYLRDTLELYLKPSRELSLALTKLDECLLWANKWVDDSK